jgi:hypothetical protein
MCSTNFRVLFWMTHFRLSTRDNMGTHTYLRYFIKLSFSDISKFLFIQLPKCRILVFTVYLIFGNADSKPIWQAWKQSFLLIHFSARYTTEVGWHLTIVSALSTEMLWPPSLLLFSVIQLHLTTSIFLFYPNSFFETIVYPILS